MSDSSLLLDINIDKAVSKANLTFGMIKKTFTF